MSGRRRVSVLAALVLATLVVAGCDSARSPARLTSQDIRAAFQDHGISLVSPPLPFTPSGQDVLSPELDESSAPYQVWVLRSDEEAERYRQLFDSGNYEGIVEANPEYRVERTVLNGNVLLVVFRGSRNGDDAAAIVDGLG